MRRTILMVVSVCTVMAAYSAPVQLWYDDFSTRWNSDGDPNNSLNIFLPATPGLAELSTNTVTYPVNTWYRRATGDSGTAFASMFSTTGAVNGAGTLDLGPPAGFVGDAGMRSGYWGHDTNYTHFSEINTGIILSNDINYQISFAAKMKYRLDPTTNLVGSGSVGLGFGFWDTTAASNNFVFFNAGGNFTNLTSTAWVTNTMNVWGGRMNLKAAGHPLILRVTKREPKNTTDFESWVDWIEITGADPWGEFVADEGLSSYDRTADDDSDGVDNFTEWAVGGDPGDDADTGLPSSAFVWESVSTNNVTNAVFSFVIPRQTNWYPNGVDYEYEGNEDLLMSGVWTNVVPWEWQPVGEGAYTPEYDAVTNYFSGTNSPASIASNETYFIRLRVDHRSYNP